MGDGDDLVDRIGSDHVGPYWISTVNMRYLEKALREHMPEQADEMLKAIGGQFETAIFNEVEVEDVKIFRWNTEETARIGHRQMVEAMTDIVAAGDQIGAIRRAARKAGFDL